MALIYALKINSLSVVIAQILKQLWLYGREKNASRKSQARKNSFDGACLQFLTPYQNRFKLLIFNDKKMWVMMYLYMGVPLLPRHRNPAQGLLIVFFPFHLF